MQMMKLLRNILLVILLSLGTIAAVMIILAFTSAPFWIWYGMGTKKAGIHRPPDCIVLMGGGGMPSESGLIRTWYAARVANYFTRSKVIIALPGDPSDSLSSIRMMKNELILRGIQPERILLEDSGTNTRSQAQHIARILSESGPRQQISLLIVTSPEHLYRAVLTFEKAGFWKVDGVPAFEQAIESDITFNVKNLGGRKFIPDIGDNITLRYQFWTQLHYETLVIREWLALGYYRISGWI
jgi:uncharacterized SAM-binding protein YcdF (DUF218 family)